jgi:hypothetical protein
LQQLTIQKRLNPLQKRINSIQERINHRLEFKKKARRECDNLGTFQCCPITEARNSIQQRLNPLQKRLNPKRHSGFVMLTMYQKPALTDEIFFFDFNDDFY